MAVQTLEFNATTGLTISCKLFAVGSDTVIDTQTATEKTNAKNRYSVAFTDAPAQATQLIGFVGAVGGYANEIYDLTAETMTFITRSEAKMRGTDGANTIAPATPTNVTNAQSSIEAEIALISGLVLSPAPTVERVLGDTDAIRFSWPADGATITGEVSKAGGTYAAVTGAISQRADESGVYWYQLAYNAADRQLGSVRYKFTDGTYTRFVNLLVNPASADVDASAIADEVQTRTIARVTLVDTTTVNSDMRGTDSASTHDAAAVVTAIGTGSSLTSCLTATGFSTHDAPAVLTALGTGSWATTLATQASVDELETIPAQIAALNNVSTVQIGATMLVALGDYNAPTLSEVTTAVSAVETKVDTANTSLTTLLNRVTTTVVTLWANLTAMITGSGGSAAFTETAMENAPAGGSGGGLGVGAFTIPLVIKLEGGALVPECDCVLTSSSTSMGVDIVASVRSDANAVVSFELDAGTYYLWRQKSGYIFSNPKTVTISSTGGVTIT